MDALGLIFYRKSPRFVSEADAKRVLRDVPPFVLRVGVFVNETSDRINRRIVSLGLDVVQLHGDESPAFCRKIRARVIRAVAVKDEKSLKGLERYPVSGFLLDAFHEKLRGGSGKTFDWKLAQKAKRYGDIVLAGGLSPDNVSEAIRKVKPHGVDVCSGIERYPGVKSNSKIRKFMKAIRGV